MSFSKNTTLSRAQPLHNLDYSVLTIRQHVRRPSSLESGEGPKKEKGGRGGEGGGEGRRETVDKGFRGNSGSSLQTGSRDEDCTKGRQEERGGEGEGR